MFAGRNWNAGETIGQSFIASAFMPFAAGSSAEEPSQMTPFPRLQSSSFVEQMGRSCPHRTYSARSATRCVFRPLGNLIMRTYSNSLPFDSTCGPAAVIFRSMDASRVIHDGYLSLCVFSPQIFPDCLPTILIRKSHLIVPRTNNAYTYNLTNSSPFHITTSWRISNT